MGCVAHRILKSSGGTSLEPVGVGWDVSRQRRRLSWLPLDGDHERPGSGALGKTSIAKLLAGLLPMHVVPDWEVSWHRPPPSPG